MKVLCLTLLLAGNVTEAVKSDAVAGTTVCTVDKKNQDCSIDQACSGTWDTTDKAFKGEMKCVKRSTCDYSLDYDVDALPQDKVMCVRSRCDDYYYTPSGTDAKKTSGCNPETAEKVCAIELSADLQKKGVMSSAKKALMKLPQNVLENEVGSKCVTCSDCIDEDKTVFCMSSKKKDGKVIDGAKDVVTQCHQTPKLKNDGLTKETDANGKAIFEKVKVLKDNDVPAKIRCGATITPPKKDNKVVPYQKKLDQSQKDLMVDEMHLHPNDVDQLRNGEPFKRCEYFKRTDKDKDGKVIKDSKQNPKVTNFLQECATVTDNIGLVYQRCVPRNLCRSMPLGMEIECNFTGRSGAQGLAAAASLMAVFYHTM